MSLIIVTYLINMISSFPSCYLPNRSMSGGSGSGSGTNNYDSTHPHRPYSSEDDMFTNFTDLSTYDELWLDADTDTSAMAPLPNHLYASAPASTEDAVGESGGSGSHAGALAVRGENSEGRERRERVAFKTKSEVEILDDGFKWRKYGKKMVKNSTNPRNYYRCSVEGCPVKKRVERDNEDHRYVITTYDGIHNHQSSYG